MLNNPNSSLGITFPLMIIINNKESLEKAAEITANRYEIMFSKLSVRITKAEKYYLLLCCVLDKMSRCFCAFDKAEEKYKNVQDYSLCISHIMK